MMTALKQNPDICFRMLCSAARAEDSTAAERIILYGVRYLNLLGEPMTERELQTRYSFYDAIMGYIGSIEPSRFVRIFPIEKDYRGHRYQSKDYFSTITMINGHGWDTPIGNAFEFLWDYENCETRIFLVNYMSLLSDIRKMQGQKGFAEEWCEGNGIPMYSMHTDVNGKKFMMSKDGRTYRVRNPRPKHLKLVTKTASVIKRG